MGNDASTQGPAATRAIPGIDHSMRTLQSVEPSHRTRNVGDIHAMAQQHAASQSQRGSQNSSPSRIEGIVPFGNRQPPPHLSGVHSLGPNVVQQLNANLDSAPLFHLPASAGGVGPKDGNVNVLSVISSQQQQSLDMNMAVGGPSRGQNASPQQNLLARLGILQQDRKASPKTMEGPGDLRMPMPQQHFNSGPPSASLPTPGSRGQYGSPVDERLENMSDRYSIKDDVHRGGPNQPGSSSSSNYGPSPVGGSNPGTAPGVSLSAKGSRLAKFFETPGDGVSPQSSHSHTGPAGMGGLGGGLGGGIMGPPSGRHDVISSPHSHQFEDPKGQMPDLLALLQGASLSQQQV